MKKGLGKGIKEIQNEQKQVKVPTQSLEPKFVKVFSIPNRYQEEMILLGSPKIWEAVDSNYKTLFESTSLEDVVNFAAKNENVTHVTFYTKTIK